MEYNRRTVSKLMNVILSDPRYMIVGGNIEGIDAKVWELIEQIDDTYIFKVRKGRSVSAIVNLSNDLRRACSMTFREWNQETWRKFRGRNRNGA